VADADASAAYGFFIFWKLDVTSSMALAGNTTRCAEFLMSNHTIAERVFRHDPARCSTYRCVYAERDGPNRFVIEQPSSALSSFSNPAIAEVGAELDEKLSGLLRHLDVPVPQDLAR
jgi:hypothetical protein